MRNGRSARWFTTAARLALETTMPKLILAAAAVSLADVAELTNAQPSTSSPGGSCR